MTRDEMITSMFEKANNLLKNYTWDAYQEIWDMSLDWNREHDESDEIFMSETCDDDGNVNGFMIEDYPYYFEEV